MKELVNDRELCGLQGTLLGHRLWHFYLSFQWQCDTWTLSSHSSTLDCVWTWSFLSPKNWEFDSPDLAKDLLVSPQASSTRDWSASDICLVSWVHHLVLRCLQETTLSGALSHTWRFGRQTCNPEMASQRLMHFCFQWVFPVFYPLIPPNHHSPWLIWVLRDSVMQSKLPWASWPPIPEAQICPTALILVVATEVSWCPLC